MRNLILSVFIMFMVTSTCYAEKSEWQDKTIDFQRIKTIMYFTPVALPTVTDSLAVQKVTDSLTEKILKKNLNVQFVEVWQVLQAIERDTGVNLSQLRSTNPNEFTKLVYSNIYKYCDAVLGTEILALGYSSQYMEAFSFPVTSYQTSYFKASGYGRSVTGSVSSPHTTYHYVPGRNVQVVNTGLRMTLYSPVSGKIIWSFSDVRDRANTTALHNTKVEDMLDRVSDSMADKLEKLLPKVSKGQNT